MITPMVALDMKVLFYAADLREPEKRAIALDIVRRSIVGNACVVWQVLGELYHSLTRKRVLSPKEAIKLVGEYAGTFSSLPSSDEAFPRAFEAVAAHGLQIWDAVLWANADAFGCKYLISEDFQDGRQLGGVTFINPFNSGNRVLLDAALPAVE